jgi:hypothetical protein
MTQGHTDSDRQQAQLLIRLTYEAVPTYNPFTINLEAVIQAFHNGGGQIPKTWPPDSLLHPELFFHLVERTAGAIAIEKLADLAHASTIEIFERYLHELKDQFTLPITSVCYLRAGMAAKLHELLIKGYPVR